MEIKVDKNDLIEKLKNNLEIHKKENKESMIGWRRKVSDAVNNLQLLTTHERFTEESLKKSKQHLDVLLYDQPTDHTIDYRRALGMLEIHRDRIINLNEKQYTQYWLDNWEWKDQWAMSNTRYK